jgi:carboxymethylenebutenolidase
MRSPRRLQLKHIVFAAVAIGIALPATAAELPERVTFQSADGKTELVGYLFKPAPMPAARVPAVVMMHGRGGAYSSRANGVYDATTLSKRHRMWGHVWAQQGYLAILVDGFGSRGYPKGFPRFSYKWRPAEVDEVTKRPLDAYGALAYLRSRPDVIADRIGLQGWSNGGSATLSAMSIDMAVVKGPAGGFRAALAFYPACRLKGRFDAGYRPYGPVRVLHGTSDEEVSALRCAALVDRSRSLGGDIQIHLYDGATHGFDDPSAKRQRSRANAAALDDAIERAVHFFAQRLGSGLK